jgi:hypothetical protein
MELQPIQLDLKSWEEFKTSDQAILLYFTATPDDQGPVEAAAKGLDSLGLVASVDTTQPKLLEALVLLG